MNRYKARENAFIALFKYSFGEPINVIVQTAQTEDDALVIDSYGEQLLRAYEEHTAAIDEEIESRLKGWTVKRLSKVNLAILRLAVTEILYGEPDIESVVINEAVELSKKFGDEEDYQFVNGLLGNFVRNRAPQAAESENANTADAADFTVATPEEKDALS